MPRFISDHRDAKDNSFDNEKGQKGAELMK